MIKPKNSDKAVKNFFDLFNERKMEVSENFVINVTKKFSDMPVPYALQEPISFHSIVKEYFDLNVSYFSTSELHFVSFEYNLLLNFRWFLEGIHLKFFHILPIVNWKKKN